MPSRPAAKAEGGIRFARNRGLPPTGRALATFWANPWAFALYGLLLALPLIVFIVRSTRGDLSAAVPILYGGASVLFLAYATMASALRVCANGVVVPESYRTLTNLWLAPEFVPWNVVSGVRNARAGVTLDLVDGSEVVLAGYARAPLELALKRGLLEARGA